ncbi:MAG: AraC family transcriptional regulator [Firmicutes bacterium]|nr:AraC family transcriptional regulator [Bacillota bacterium]
MTEDLIARVSYLKGLAEGLSLDEESKEGKLLLRIVDLLDEMAGAVVQLQTDYEELFEYSEALDEDLAELEDDFYEDDVEDDDDDYGEYECFTVECPNCGEMVEISEDLLHTDIPVKVTCPVCNEVVLIDDEEWEDEDFDELLSDEKEEEKE